MSVTTRQQLHQQIDKLPDHMGEQIARFTLLITTGKNNILEYTNWQDQEWQ